MKRSVVCTLLLTLLYFIPQAQIGIFQKVIADSIFSKDFRFRSLPNYSLYNGITNIISPITGTYDLTTPPGTTAQRPVVPTGKYILRYNTDSSALEIGNPSQVWKLLSMSSVQTFDTSAIQNFGLKVRSLISATSPLQYNVVTGVLSIPQATSSTAGYLASADWVTFNAKLPDPGSNGIVVRTASGITAARQLVAASTNISIVNPNGVSGNPSIDVNDTLSLRQLHLPYIPAALSTADSALFLNRSTGYLEVRALAAAGTGTFNKAGGGISYIGDSLFLNQSFTRALFSATAPITYNSSTGVFGADTGILATQYDLTQIPTIYTADGTLPANRTVNTGGFTTLWTGSNDNETSFSVNNTGTTNGNAIAGSAVGTTSVGVSGTSTSYIGILGTSTSNNGIQGQSTSGTGVVGISSTGAALRGQINPSSNNTIENALTLLRTSSAGAGANNEGAAIQFELETATSGTSQIAGTLAFKFTDATNATRGSQFEIYGVNNAVSARKAALAATGQWIWDGYPALTAQIDTTTYKPVAIDGSGNVVKMAGWTGSGGGGGSGTVTQVNTGFGLAGGPITTTGTINVDSGTIATNYKLSLKQNQFIINVKDFGATGDAKKVADGSATASSATFTSATASFTSADIGKLIWIQGAGAAGVDLRTTIAGFTNSTTITLTDNAVTTVNPTTFWYGTNDYVAIKAAIAAMPTNGGDLVFPTGQYFCRGGTFLIEKPIQFIGMGNSQPYSTIVTATEMQGSGILTDSLAGDFIKIRAYNTSFYNIAIKNINRFSTPIAGCGINFSHAQVFALLQTHISGFYDGIRLDSSWLYRIDGSFFSAWVNRGIYITATSSCTDCGDASITSTQFGAYWRDNNYAIYQEAGGGLKISNCKFNGGEAGIRTSRQIYCNILATTSDLLIANNSFENYDSTALVIKGNNIYNNIIVDGNQFWSPAPGVGIFPVEFHKTKNIVFSDNDIAAPVDGYVVLFDTCSNIQHKGNTMRDYLDNITSIAVPAITFQGCDLINIDRYQQVQTLTNNAGFIDFNVNDGNNAKHTLAGNASLNMQGSVNGERGRLFVTQDGTGGWTLALPGNTTNVNWLTSAGAVNQLEYFYDGTQFYWASIGGGGAGGENLSTTLGIGNLTGGGVPIVLEATSGTNRNSAVFNDNSGVDDVSTIVFRPASGTNALNFLQVVPRNGGAYGLMGGVDIFGTDKIADPNNLEFLRMDAIGTQYQFNSRATGTGSARPIKFQISGSDAIAIGTNKAVTFNSAFTLPLTDGTSGQVLQTNGSGAVTWQTVAGGSQTWQQTLTTGSTLTGNNTVTGGNNSFTFDGMFNYRINANAFVLDKTSAAAPYTQAVLGTDNRFQIGFTPTAAVYDKGSGIIIDTNNNTGIGVQMPTTAPRYASGRNAYADNLLVEGGQYAGIANITSNTTLDLEKHYIRVDATSGNVTITLPAVSTAFGASVGIEYIFKRIDNSGNTVTIQRAGSDTIDGATSFTLTTQYEVKKIIASSTSTWDVF
jgi:hypothetical protein